MNTTEKASLRTAELLDWFSVPPSLPSDLAVAVKKSFGVWLYRLSSSPPSPSSLSTMSSSATSGMMETTVEAEATEDLCCSVVGVTDLLQGAPYAYAVFTLSRSFFLQD